MGIGTESSSAPNASDLSPSYASHIAPPKSCQACEMSGKTCSPSSAYFSIDQSGQRGLQGDHPLCAASTVESTQLFHRRHRITPSGPVSTCQVPLRPPLSPSPARPTIASPRPLRHFSLSYSSKNSLILDERESNLSLTLSCSLFV